jgi:hypothetical protein
MSPQSLRRADGGTIARQLRFGLEGARSRNRVRLERAEIEVRQHAQLEDARRELPPLAPCQFAQVPWGFGTVATAGTSVLASWRSARNVPRNFSSLVGVGAGPRFPMSEK